MYECEICHCRLDPGEGRLCDDCRKDQDEEQRRKKKLDQMLWSTKYRQMEMEEFLNGCKC